MKPLSLQEKTIFASELEMILSSGLDIHQGLEIIIDQLPSQNLKQTVLQIQKIVEEEGTFFQGVAQSQAFDPYTEQMIQTGEISGHLDEVLKELVKYYQRQQAMNKQLKEAFTYPFILLIMMFLIVALMVFKVLPIFEDVLSSTGASSDLMTFGMRFGQVSFLALLVLLVVVVLFGLYFLTSKNKQGMFKFLASFKLTRKIVKNLSLARLTYALSLFVSSGYPIEQTMDILCAFVEHPKLKKKIEAVRDDVNQGASFGESLLKHQIYEGLYANMLAIGVHTGQQDAVLKKLGDLYQDEVQETTARFLNIIEPLIIALLSIIVGVILLSIMLPLLGILNVLG